MTSRPSSAEAATAAERRVPRTLIAVGVVVALAAAVALGTHLAYDPFADLPDDESVMVNLAGVIPAEGEEPLQKPLGITIDGNRVFVAESAAGAVRIFDRYGRDKGSITVPAAGTGSLPIALALTADGRLAIVDGARGEVVVVKARAGEQAEVLFALGNARQGTAPARPVAVAYEDGEFYAIGASEMRVMVYDNDGVFVREMSAGSDLGQSYPGSLVVADGIVHVSDTKSGRIVMFDAKSGEAMGEWPDTYRVPRGLAETSNGFALADVLGQTVYICNEAGAQTHVVSADAVPDAPLVLPEGVAWDALKSRLYVTDSVSGSVVVLNVRDR